MGYVRVRCAIANPFKRDLKAEVEFIADTGAIYSVITPNLAKKLELKVIDKRKFKIASGELVEYPVSEAYFELEGKGITSLVALGSEEAPPLLGVTTLELFGLKVDPITGKLTPLELMIL